MALAAAVLLAAACNLVTGVDRLEKVNDGCDSGCSDAETRVEASLAEDGASPLDASTDAAECAEAGAALPNLEIDRDPVFSPQPRAGFTFAVTLYIRNAGKAATDSAVGFSVFEGTLRLADIPPAGGSIAPSQEIPLTGNVPALTAGQHTLTFVVDPSALECQRDRSGSTRTITINVTTP